MRRVVGTVVLLAAALLVGCSGKGDDRADGDPASSTTTTSFGEQVSDEEFADVVGELDDKVAAADGDFCALVAATDFAPTAMPSNPTQVEAAVTALADLYRAIADAGALDPDDAGAIDQFAGELEQQARSSDYSVDVITGKQSSELAASPEYAPALAALDDTAAAECGAGTGATSQSTSTPSTTTTQEPPA